MGVSKELEKQKKAIESQIEKSEKAVLEHGRSIERLIELVQKEFSPERMKQYLLDLCEAKQVMVTKNGDVVELPDWTARRDGFDRALKIGYAAGPNLGTIRENAPTKIVFNIVNGKADEPKKVVEVEGQEVKEQDKG